MSRSGPDFRAVFNSLTLDEASLSKPVDATFIPDSDLTSRDLAELPLVRLDDEGTGADLKLGELIGAGGRGEVRLADQRALRRSVAVKRLKNRAEGVAAMLQEARVTGNLEHPNIVPVYSVGRAESGDVLLVMKRVQGAPWGTLLKQEGVPRTDADVDRHLDIFKQVCRALEFAHSKGVLHRDLKPDNVMVGAFGEVVVLDWGLAMAMPGAANFGAESSSGLAGTPAYMAPEQVQNDDALLGPWTDVYLLGATLYRVLTGRAPHTGQSLEAVLEHAFHSPPPAFTALVPTELAKVCTRAMAAAPSERFQTVTELREAIQSFAAHRQSVALATEARRLLDEAPVDRFPIVVAQSRFGFEQALRAWPENDVAKAGLLRAFEKEVLHAVAQRDVKTARAALAQLASPADEFTHAVRALEASLEEEAREQSRLRSLELELDPNVTLRQRNAVQFGLGVSWFAVTLVLGIAERLGAYTVTYGFVLAATVIWVGALLLVDRLWSGQIRKNLLGRQIANGFTATVLGGVAVRLISALHGVEVHLALMFELLVTSACTAVVASFFDRRVFIISAAYGTAALLSAAWQPGALLFTAGANVCIATAPWWWQRLAPK